MPNHFKVHELLSRDELDQLEAFAREPGRTVDECWQWMLERSFTLSRGAVANWLQAERFNASNDVARAVLEAAKGKDAVELSSAASETMAQLLFEHLLQLQNSGKIATKDLVNATAGLKNVITSQRHLEKLEEEVAAKQKKALDEADKAVKTGASGEAIVQKVREILGVG